MYEENEVAVRILFEKYNSLIKSRLQRFNIKPQNYEDFYQEGLMALHEAMNVYNPFYNKTFNKFFDLVLQRRIMNVLKKERKYFYCVNIVDNMNHLVYEKDETGEQLQYYQTLFSGFAEQVFLLRFNKGYKPREIAEILKCDVKKVYNALYHIRKKIRKLPNKD